MPRILALIVPALLAACASTSEQFPERPEDICQSINPHPGAYMLSGPEVVSEGIKVGSVRTQVKDGRCEISAAVYMDSEVMISELMRSHNVSRAEAEELARSDEFHQRMTSYTTETVQQSVDRLPPDTVRLKYQYLPTKPIRPFAVTVEN